MEIDKQTLTRTLRHFADRLSERPDYDPDVVELIHAFHGLADLAESATSIPGSPRLTALMGVLEKAVARLPLSQA